MYRCGFVPNEYVVEAIYQANAKRHDSEKRNHQRLMYESVENDKEVQFQELLDTEIEKLRRVM